MRVLVFSSSFPPAHQHGGVPFSTYYLCKALSALGCELLIISSDRDGTSRLDVARNCWTRYDGLAVYYYKTLPGPYCYGRGLYRIAAEAANQADIILSSGTLWNHAGWVAGSLRSKFKIPHVVYLRGLLQDWAWNYKPWRKRFFWFFQGRRVLQQAACIVALSESEKRALSRFHLNTSIEVIPNGVDREDMSDVYAPDEFQKLHPQLAKNKYLLFLGRVSAQKGLELLVRAFSEIQHESKEIYLVICGPILPEYRAVFQRLLSEAPEAVKYLGVVKGKLKNSLLKYCYGLVLPSSAEGMPMAVLEAMSLGKPVIISEHCNLPDVQRMSAGFVLKLNQSEWQQAMIELISDPQQAESLGQNAAKLIEQCYAWGRIASETKALFEKLHFNTPQQRIAA